jgi:hypothetical protein
MEELKIPSLGKELIEKIKSGELLKETKEETIIEETIIEETMIKEEKPVVEEKDSIPTEYASFIKDGVEVVDVKAIPKPNKKLSVDKFGIPISGNRSTWDKI